MKTLKKTPLFVSLIIVLTSILLIIFFRGTIKSHHQSFPENNAMKDVKQEQQRPEMLNPAFVQSNKGYQIHQLEAQPVILKTTTSIQKIYYQKKVAVLTYHHLDPIESSVTITPERFKSHLIMLKNNGFNVISMEDFIAFLQKKKTVPPNAVVITFDDGYESVYKYAYPVLKSEGMEATVFLIVSYIDDGIARQPPILKWSQIIQMHNEGFSFYSHSYNSHGSVVIKEKEVSELTIKKYNQSTNQLETDNEYKTRILSDLTKADDILNVKLGNKVNLLCLPHGQYNKTVIDIAKQSNILYLFTGKEGINTEKTKLINRINAGSPYMSDKLLIRRLSQGK
jgi:biofilm PGA synthesis lipoprotein PgaB